MLTVDVIECIVKKYTGSPFKVRNWRTWELATGLDTYERLEWLGDKVIDLYVSWHLYQKYCDDESKDCGELTRIRILITQNENINSTAPFVRASHAIFGHHKWSRTPDNKTYSDLFEAFVGALYLEAPRLVGAFVKNIIFAHIDFDELIKENKNYKDRLMRYYHKEYNDMKNNTPSYRERCGKYAVIDPFGKQICEGGSEVEAAKGALGALGILDDDAYERIMATLGEKILLQKSEKAAARGAPEIVAIDDCDKNCEIDRAFVRECLRAYTGHRADFGLELFELAFVHGKNAKLKWFGNKLVEGVITILLYEYFGGLSEGALSVIRTILIRNTDHLFGVAGLANMCRHLDFPKYIQLTDNAIQINGRENDKILTGVFEAFCGALFECRGLFMVIGFVQSVMWRFTDLGEIFIAYNEYTQYKIKLKKRCPGARYNTREIGVEELKGTMVDELYNELKNEKSKVKSHVFKCEVVDGRGIVLGVGYGKRIKIAEQAAAKNALALAR